MNETDYKGGILHLCIAFWLFITVHRLEIMLIWHGIWWSECSATKTVTGEKQKMTVSPSPLLLTSSCDTTQLHPSGTVMRQERTGLGLGAKLPSDTLGKVPKLSLYSPLVSLPPCVALIETPCWRGEQRAGQESCASHTGQDYRNQIFWIASALCGLLQQGLIWDQNSAPSTRGLIAMWEHLFLSLGGLLSSAAGGNLQTCSSCKTGKRESGSLCVSNAANLRWASTSEAS